MSCRTRGFRLVMSALEPGDVVLGDAAFENYCAVAALRERGVDAVFEINGTRRLPGRRTLVTLRRPKARPAWMSVGDFAALPKTLRLRRVRVGHKGHETKTLLTTMIDTRTVLNRAIGQLYRRRWEVELDFRSLEQTPGMDVLRCTTPSLVACEIWVHLLAYNLIRTLMAQAAVRHGREPRSMSFKHALQLWSTWQQQGVPANPDSLEKLYAAMAQRKIGHRPGRREPRAIKRRPKPRALLLTPRAQARRECERYERH